ncbi:hypothetical protein EUGRSUZ_D01983 [Eucalyptus grandis]|uniref:Uncharacterized protein n=2 Tax=Eucalyptus grandis TaxID=71139 RepID=A0ACC3L797_EUCGR|nr:hypothetical protein EUGRSUZ_D01983 [Eucalyptus grandis]
MRVFERSIIIEEKGALLSRRASLIKCNYHLKFLIVFLSYLLSLFSISIFSFFFWLGGPLVYSEVSCIHSLHEIYIFF